MLLQQTYPELLAFDVGRWNSRTTGPLASQFILSLGASYTFATGSIVLLGAAAILRSVNPQARITSSEISVNSAVSQRISLLNLGLIFW